MFFFIPRWPCCSWPSCKSAKKKYSSVFKYIHFQFHGLSISLFGFSRSELSCYFVIFGKAIESVYDFSCLLIAKKKKKKIHCKISPMTQISGLSFAPSDSSPLSAVISQCGSETCAAWLAFCWRHNARYTHQQRYAADISQILQVIWHKPFDSHDESQLGWSSQSPEHKVQRHFACEAACSVLWHVTTTVGNSSWLL